MLVMSSGPFLGRGPLWAKIGNVDDQALPFWRALIIALGMEIIVPFLIYGVDWSFLPSFNEPPPVEVMSVRLEEPPPALEEPPPPKGTGGRDGRVRADRMEMVRGRWSSAGVPEVESVGVLVAHMASNQGEW